jgi:CHASE3 domain sensor protein
VEEVEELVQETEQAERAVRTEQGHILQEIHDLATRLQSLEEKLRGHLDPGPGPL